MAQTVAVRKPIAALSRNPADPAQHIDWGLLAATLALCAIGVVAIYTATFSAFSLAGGDTLYYVKRQLIALAIGLVVMVVAMAVDYRKWRDFAVGIFLATLALLVLLIVVGRRVNGAEAWFNIGPFQLQPSELVKVSLVLMLAAYVANERSHGLPFTRFVGALVLLAIPAALVLAQPDLGTSSVLIVITMAVLLVGGANPRHIALITLLAIISAGVLIGTGALRRDQQSRLTAFVQQDATPRNKSEADLQRQVTNSKAAIADGGITGQGYLKGDFTNGAYVPEQHTDFVFSAIAEQFGLVGSAVVLFLYAFVLWRLWRIARLAQDLLGTLIAVGAMALIAWHVFENIGMTMGLMPVTGIPLPLLSYGGSSAIAILAMLGLVQSVHMRRFV
jgi:rod shape determining protein RodA